MATIRVKIDYQTIQDAVDAAFPGDEILVEDGIYREQVTVGKNYIKIIGAGKTILDGGMKLDTGFILNDTTGVEIKCFIIKNFRSDGIDILGSGNTNVILNTHVLNINYYGVSLGFATRNNKFMGGSIIGAYYGVYDLGSYFSLENCLVSYCSTGVYLNTDSDHAHISSCSIKCNGVGINANGINMQVIRSQVHKSRNTGIYVEGSNSLIEGNEVKETINYDGIYLAYGSNFVKGNQVCSNGRNGILVDVSGNDSVVGNEVNDNAAAGILVTFAGNIIEGNVARGNGSYDIVRVWANNIVRNNFCGESLPPWLGKEPKPDSEGETPYGAEEASSGECDVAPIRVPSDYPTIQSAVDAAVPGDVILVEDGIYHEQVTINKSFIKITGGGKTILDGEMKLHTGLILSGTSGVEVKGLLIKNFMSDGIDILGNGLKNIIKKVKVLNVNYYGISLDPTTANNRIIQSTIEGSYHGIYDRSSDLQIDASQIDYNGCYGVYSTGQNVQISRSIVSNNFDTGIECLGSGTHINACKVFRNRNYGMKVGDSSLVESNEVYSNEFHAIGLLGHDSIAKENKVWSNKNYGIISNTHNSIIDNSVNDNMTSGIVLISGNFVEGNTAHGNVLYDIVRSDPDNRFRNNVCGKSLPPWLCEGCGWQLEDVDICPTQDGCVIATIHVPTDYLTIQAAVDAAFPGDIILVESGVYCEQVTINKSFIKIIGEDKTILDGELKLQNGFTFSEASGVEIESFMIKNFRTNGIDIRGGSHEISIFKIIISNTAYGISLDSSATNCLISGSSIIGGILGIYNLSSNLHIEGCRISYNSSTGLYSRSNNLHINGSIVSNNYGNGINFDLSSGSACITNNKLYENRVTSLIARGSCLIRGNEVYNNYSSAIGAMSINCVVKENKVYSNTGEGILVNSGSAVIRNKVHDNRGYGISIRGMENVIEGNTVRGNANYDIVANRANNTIRNNVCSKSAPPWLCEGCSPQPEEGDGSDKDQPEACAEAQVFSIILDEEEFQ